MASNIFIVAGEASADRAAASLVRDMKREDGSFVFYGIGGKNLQDVGVTVDIPSEAINVVGFSDWFGKAREVIISYRRACKLIEKRRPDIAILLDLPDFNLRLAKRLKKLNVPVVYYFSPQIWAWRKNRLQQIKETVSRMLVVFPFEVEIYQSAGVPVTLVEHPLLKEVLPRKRYRDQAEILSAPRICIMPGSRKSEVSYHSTLIKELIKEITHKYPKAQIKVPVAPTLSSTWVKTKIGLSDEQISSDTAELLNWADLGVVASGTATLEAALSGLPFCLYYKVSRSSAWFFRKILKYKGFLGMPNILTKEETVKEFFQEQATSKNIFFELDRLIKKGPARLQMVSRLLECRKYLGEKSPSPRPAKEVLAFLNQIKK